jgi:hypothetical protein
MLRFLQHGFVQLDLADIGAYGDVLLWLARIIQHRHDGGVHPILATVLGAIA